MNCGECDETFVCAQVGVPCIRLALPAAPAPVTPVVREPRHVRKVGGSFEHTGTVVAEFKTLAGEPRIVLEFDAPVAGMLHVYRPDQVEPCESAAPAVREPKDTETSRLLANVADAARRLVEHADFQLGGILSADSKAKEIPSKAVSQVKARHHASLRDRVAELDAAHGIGGGGNG